MNQKSPTPWVNVDADDGTFSLYGNAEGFQILRKAIDDLLATGANEVRVPIRQDGVRSIAISNEDPDDDAYESTASDRFLSTLGILILAAIPISILLLAAFGLIQLIHFISNF